MTRKPEPSAIETVTSDGVRLRGIELPGPADATVRFVVWHGMTNSTAKPNTRAALQALSAHGPVAAFDFRGHGRSGGRSSVGDTEVRDVQAGLTFARSRGDLPVVVVGFSLGAAVTLRHAGATRRDPSLGAVADAVVSVSAPARWFLRGTPSMRRVQWLLEQPLGPLLSPLVGIRLGAPWSQLPSTPLEEVAGIAPTPLLLVHGTADHYFPPGQAELLHRAATGSDLMVVDGMGHAESGVSTQTLDQIAQWAIAATSADPAAHAPAGQPSSTLGRCASC